MIDTNQYERHFNDMQMKLRTIGSTWALAALAGIAFLMVKAVEPEPIFNRFTLVNVICTMTVIAMFVLWLIDQLAYQKLFDACLIVDLFAEYKDHQHPPVKALMAYAAKQGMWVYYN